MGSSSFSGLSGIVSFSSFKNRVVFIGLLFLVFTILSGRAVAVSAADDSLPKESPAVETVQQPAPETDTDVPSKPMEKTASDSSEKNGKKEDTPIKDEEETHEQRTPMSATGEEEPEEDPRPPEISAANIDITQYSGAAVADIPIIVPPGRAGIQPQIKLNYNSNRKNGWIGMGWDIDMGTIQRSVKHGLDYTQDDYESTLGGLSELAARPDWGAGLYGAKIESKFKKYYFNPNTKGWEVTDRTGTRYYLGSTDAARQSDPSDPNRIFKWCLDRVVDTNNNYMVFSYIKEDGQIYLSRIDYTGNQTGTLAPSNSVIFHTETTRPDPVLSYQPRFKTSTNRCLKTIEVQSSDSIVRAYKFTYSLSEQISRSLLTRLERFGTDTAIENGTVVSGTAFPGYNFNWLKGNQHAQFEAPIESSNGDPHPGGNYTVTFTDINGDGLADMVVDNHPLHWQDPRVVTTRFSLGDASNKAQSISLPSQSTIAFEYVNSTEYAQTFLPFHMNLVSNITRDDGNGVVSSTSYSYADGLYDPSSREFRGFGRVTQTHPDGTTSQYQFLQGEFDKGRPYRTETRSPGLPGEPGALLSLTTTDWQVDFLDAPDNTVGFVKPLRSRTEMYDSQTVFRQEDSTYDPVHGQVLTRQISGTGAESVTQTFTYGNFGDWCWRPVSRSLAGDVTGLARQTEYGYEITTGNLITEKQVLDGIHDPVVTLAYDGFGNEISRTDARGHTTHKEYDAQTQTFVVETRLPETNGISHISRTLDLDYRFGTPLLTEDENGNQTAYSYDLFGRPVQVDMPEGRQILTRYNDTASPRSVVSKVKADASGNFIQTTTFLDGFNRTVQTVAPGENGQYLITRTHYDDMGRAYLAQGPFIAGTDTYPQAPPVNHQWLQTVFDDRGRPVSQDTQSSEHAAITTTYEYTGLSTRITDPDGAARTQTRDYLDRITRVVEHADAGDFTTTYTYNGAGDLTQITDHNANPTGITYDLLGRKTRMADPDMGVWQYTYDANGNLLTRTDAKNQTLTHAYDALNRVTLKTFSTGDPDVVYTYDDPSVSNGRGLLYQVSDGETTTTVNGYNSFGDILSETRTIAGAPQSYTTQYTYDLSGKPLTTTHPDGLTLTRTFFAGTNLLEQVTGSDGTVYARLSNYTPQGKIGRIAYPNATHTDYTYDDRSGRLTAIRTTGPAGTLLDRTYTYTPAGDISSTADGVAGVTYGYAYDRLHRLISETGAGSDRVFSYDALGNIITKTHGPDTLAYTYAGPAPHAVTQIDINGSSYPLSYDANGNMVSGPDLTDPSQPGTRTVTYNGANMPRSIEHTRDAVTTRVGFTYDHEDRRVKKSIADGPATFYIGEHFQVKAEAGTAESTNYIFAGTLRIAKITDGTTLYFHKDHLGSSSVLTDISGLPVEQTAYLPYGHERSRTGSDLSDYKFTDQEKDRETGLYNYDARLYDPVLGRFTMADTLLPDLYNPQALNRYAYVLNNPLIYTDPTGHYPGTWDGSSSTGTELNNGNEDAQDFADRLDNSSYDDDSNDIVHIETNDIEEITTPSVDLVQQAVTTIMEVKSTVDTIDNIVNGKNPVTAIGGYVATEALKIGAMYAGTKITKPSELRAIINQRQAIIDEKYEKDLEDCKIWDTPKKVVDCMNEAQIQKRRSERKRIDPIKSKLEKSFFKDLL